jgi:hypothetical protein
MKAYGGEEVQIQTFLICRAIKKSLAPDDYSTKKQAKIF